MNRLRATITSVNTSDTLSIAVVEIHKQQQLSVILIETPASADYLKEGQDVYCLFKETEVILSTATENQTSLCNHFKAKIIKVEKSKLLSNLVLQLGDESINAIVNSEAINRLQLTESNTINCMIKMNEIMLSPR